MSEKQTKTVKDDFKKARKKHKVRRTVTSLLLAFALLYLPVVLIASGGAGARISLITTGTISDSIKTEGLLLKEEKLIFLPFDGTYTKTAEEGERIPAGSTIATVVEDAYASKLKELESLSNEILMRKKEGSLSSGIFTRDLRQIENEISQTVGEIASVASQGRIGDLAYLEEELNRLESARNEIVSGSMTTDQYTEELERQYAILKESLAGKVTEIKAAEPGYLSFEPDGYEDFLSESDIGGFTAIETQTAIRQFGKENPSQTGSKPFAKLVTGNSYTLVTVLDESDADRIRNVQAVEIIIEDLSLLFSADEFRFGAEDGKKTVVYIEINKKLGELVSQRHIDFEIQINKHSGFMVPIRSLLNYEAYPIRKVELAKVTDNWIEFIEVEVIAVDKTHALIKPVEGTLNLYDYYAVNPKRVEEGQVVR